MPGLREIGYQRIPQSAIDDSRNDREMLGFHQQIYDHALGRIAAGDQVDRYRTLADKILGMNPHVVTQAPTPVQMPQVAPQPERNKGGYAQPPQPAAQPSTVMSSPDYNPGYSYEPSATPRGLKTTPQPAAPATSFPVHTPAPVATTVMSSPEYNPNPATSQSPGNGAAYAQQPSGTVMTSPEYHAAMSSTPAQSPGNGSGTVMTSPEYHSAMSARAKPAATVGAPVTGGINGYGPSQIPLSSFSYNAPNQNEGAPADIVYNNGGPKGSVDPSNPYERAPGGWGIWSRQPQQYGRRPNLGGLKIAP